MKDTDLKALFKRIFELVRPDLRSYYRVVRKAKIVKTYASDGKYWADVQPMRNDESVDETEPVVPKVEIPIMWGGPKRGVVCPPLPGTHCDLEYYDGDPNYPRISNFRWHDHQAPDVEVGGYIIQREPGTFIKIDAENNLIKVTPTNIRNTCGQNKEEGVGVDRQISVGRDSATTAGRDITLTAGRWASITARGYANYSDQINLQPRYRDETYIRIDLGDQIHLHTPTNILETCYQDKTTNIGQSWQADVGSSIDISAGSAARLTAPSINLAGDSKAEEIAADWSIKAGTEASLDAEDWAMTIQKIARTEAGERVEIHAPLIILTGGTVEAGALKVSSLEVTGGIVMGGKELTHCVCS